MMFCLRKMMFAPSELRDGSYYRIRLRLYSADRDYCKQALDASVACAMILLTQMMFERCSNDALLAQNDIRTRANLGMARIIE